MFGFVRFVALLLAVASAVTATEGSHHIHTYETYTEYLVFRNKLAEKILKAELSLLFASHLHQSADAVYFAVANKIPGDISEFGVFKGGASIMMASVLFYLEPNTTRQVHMFDSFAGHPDYTATKKEDFDMLPFIGKIVAPIEGVLAALKAFGLYDRYQAKQIVLHKGWFKDTAPLLKRPLALIRADGDAYSSTMDILNNTYKLLSPRGAVIVDDYDYYQSCRNAIHDFFKDNNIPMTDLRFPNDVSLGLRPFWIKKY